MCDRIAIMDRGHVHQIASPADMYRNPVNTFVAGFLGNPPIAFLSGRVRGGRFWLDGSTAGIDLPGGCEDLEDGREIRLGVRPEHVRPADSGPLSGKVSFVETHGRGKPLRRDPERRPGAAFDPAGTRRHCTGSDRALPARHGQAAGLRP